MKKITTTTIIIPALKNSLILKNTINHCLNLKNTPDIFIVTDDKNNLFFNENKNVNYLIVQPGLTMSKKRNLAAKNTYTEYLAFFDSDSFPVSSYWIENAIKKINQDENIYCVGGPDTSPLSQNESQKSVGLLKKSYLISGFRNHRKNIMPEMFVNELSSSNLFMRRKKYLELGGMDENLYTGEDTDLYNRIIAKGKKLLYSPDVHAYHYDRTFKSFLIERYDRGMQSTVAIKSYIKNILYRNNIQKGSAYTSKTFRFEFLLNPFFFPYIIFIIFNLKFKITSNLILLPLYLMLTFSILDSIRLCKFNIKIFSFFLKLILSVIICSMASFLLFFNISINLKKYYRNFSDTYN